MKKWLVSLLFFTVNVFAQSSMITKVIDLRYQNADHIIPLVQPLLQNGEEISGSGQTLVVKVLPNTLTQLRTVLHKLDQPPVTFKITIYQGDPDWLDTQNNDSTISTVSTESRSNQLQSQSVTVMNGESAFVSTGQDQPVVSSVSAGWAPGISYDRRMVQNGLLVQPVLQGEQVKLSVRRMRQQDSRVSSQQFDDQQVVTTVMVPLNQWVSLASVQGSQPSASSTTQVIRVGDQFSQNSTLYIKVNVVDGQNSTTED